MQLSLANKYRPQNFDTMIGQQHIIGILKAKMQASRDSLQNYLLTGPRGTGKTTSARILAKAINCLNLQEGNPCNQCANCQTIAENKTLDYVEIDAASHTGVDNIREEILDKSLYPPTTLKKKIYVIDEVHMLSKGAFNSLLKTIEEPKGNVCFILATTEIQKVPDTIVSRCQTFLFKKVSEQEIALHLAEIAQKEGFEYETEALELIATIADGGVRDSIKYLDQVSILGKITAENVSTFLGIVSEVRIKQFIEIIKKREKKQIAEEIDLLNDQGRDLFQFAKQVIGFLDKHLLEDITNYLPIAKAMTAILKQLKYYPYPTVLYKMELLQLAESSTSPSVISSSPDSAVSTSGAPASIKSPQAQHDSISQYATPPIAPSSVVTKSSVVSASREVVGASTPQTHNTLRAKLIESLPANTLKSSLQQHTLLEQIQDGVAKLIVTNKLAEVSLNKPEHKAEIEKRLSEVLGTPTVIEISFESKEAYMSRSLGLC